MNNNHLRQGKVKRRRYSCLFRIVNFYTTERKLLSLSFTIHNYVGTIKFLDKLLNYDNFTGDKHKRKLYCNKCIFSIIHDENIAQSIGIIDDLK